MREPTFINPTLSFFCFFVCAGWNAQKNKQVPRKERKDKVAFDKSDIERFGHLPQEEACKHLKMSVRTLRKRCRELGLERWPYMPKKGKGSRPRRKQASAPAKRGKYPTATLPRLRLPQRAVREVQRLRDRQYRSPTRQIARRERRLN